MDECKPLSVGLNSRDVGGMACCGGAGGAVAGGGGGAGLAPGGDGAGGNQPSCPPRGV